MKQPSCYINIENQQPSLGLLRQKHFFFMFLMWTSSSGLRKESISWRKDYLKNSKLHQKWKKKSSCFTVFLLENIDHGDNSSSRSSGVSSVSNNFAASGNEDSLLSPRSLTGLDHSLNVLVFSNHARSDETRAFNSEVDNGVGDWTIGPWASETSQLLWTSNVDGTARESGDSKAGNLFGSRCSSCDGNGGGGWENSQIESLNGNNVSSAWL